MVYWLQRYGKKCENALKSLFLFDYPFTNPCWLPLPFDFFLFVIIGSTFPTFFVFPLEVLVKGCIFAHDYSTYNCVQFDTFTPNMHGQYECNT